MRRDLAICSPLFGEVNTISSDNELDGDSLENDLERLSGDFDRFLSDFGEISDKFALLVLDNLVFVAFFEGVNVRLFGPP